MGTSIESLGLHNKAEAKLNTRLNIFIRHRSHAKTTQGKPLSTVHLTNASQKFLRLVHEFRMVPNRIKVTIVREKKTQPTTSNNSGATKQELKPSIIRVQQITPSGSTKTREQTILLLKEMATQNQLDDTAPAPRKDLNNNEITEKDQTLSQKLSKT